MSTVSPPANICASCAAVPTHHTLQAYQGKRPVLGSGAFVAPNASVVGDVRLGKGSSVWYGAVLRGEQCTSGNAAALHTAAFTLAI